MVIYVIVAEGLDPSFYVEVAFTFREDADAYMKSHPSNETVTYSIHEVELI